MTKKLEIQLHLSVESKDDHGLGDLEIPLIHLYPNWVMFAVWINSIFDVYTRQYETAHGFRILEDGIQVREVEDSSKKRYQERVDSCTKKRYSCSECTSSKGPGLDCGGNPGLEFSETDQGEEGLEDIECPGIPEYCSQNSGDCETCSLSSYSRDCRNNPIKKQVTEGQEEMIRLQADEVNGIQLVDSFDEHFDNDLTKEEILLDCLADEDCLPLYAEVPAATIERIRAAGYGITDRREQV